MSKSAGNIVDPFALVEKYGAEALRYYLMSDIATGKDADFSEQRLIERYNVDLANSLGNLLNRTLNMAAKYRSGKIRSVRFTFAIGAFDSPDNESDLAALVVNFPVDSKRFGLDYSGYFDSHRVSTALEHAWQAVNSSNRAEAGLARAASLASRATGFCPLLCRRVASHHCDLDFAGIAACGAWDFRSTELEDGVERQRRAVLTQRRGVGEIAR